MSTTNKTPITFLDVIGRTIIGVINTDLTDDHTLAVINPALLHIVPNHGSGQIQLQILPLFFREFQADKEADITWLYLRKNIVENTGIDLDFRVSEQYKAIVNPPSPIIQPSSSIATPSVNEQKTIRLFD